MSGSRPPLPPGCRTVLWCFGALGVGFTGFFPPTSNPNELSRIEAVSAIADRGTFAIDTTLAEFGDQEDKSSANGRFYSNKAPGLVLAAVPAYAVLRTVFGRPSRPTAPIFVAARFATVSLVSLLALAAFARRLGRDGPAEAAALVLFAVAFGTPFVFYARSFFSHAWTASLLFLSWESVRAAEEKAGAAGRRLAAAGLLAGAAAISEYPAAPIALLLAVRAGIGRGGRGIGAFAAGAALPIALLLGYDAVCFGSPLVFSFEREADPRFANLAGVGFYGVRLPTAQTAWDALFHPARGVLLLSPFGVFAAPGFVRWWRSRSERKDAGLALAAAAALFLLVAAYRNWEGGWSLGMRYLLPGLFFVADALPRALASVRSRVIFASAAAFSGANFLLLSSTYPHVPESVAWPAATLSWPLLTTGRVAPNLATSLGGPPAAGFAFAAGLFAVALVAAAGKAVPSAPALLAAVLVGVGALTATVRFPPSLSAEGRDEYRQVERRVVGAPRPAPHRRPL